MRSLFVLCSLCLPLGACWCPPFPPAEAPPECEIDWDLDWDGSGPAPWDGVYVEIDVESCGHDIDFDASPWVVDELGEPVDLEPVPHCRHRWLPPDDFAPGSYTFQGIRAPSVGTVDQGENIPTDPIPFVVEPWGRDAAFEPAALEGRSFMVSMEQGLSCTNPLLVDFLPGLVEGALFLEVLQVEGASADIRLVREPIEEEDAPACILMTGTADLTATGELSWSYDEIELASEPGIRMTELWLRFGFDAAGEQARGVEGRGIVDLRNMGELEEFDDWQDACNLFASFGMPCEACGDGLEACLDLDLFQGAALRADRSIDPELPPCFITPDIPGFEWDTGWRIPDCQPICAARRPGAFIAGLWLLALAALIRRQER